MVIGRGRDWGCAGPLAASGIVVHSDAEAGEAVGARLRQGEPLPELGLLAGDLARTLGAGGDERRLRSPRAQRLPIDLGLVELDGEQHCFVAHLVARRAGWRGRFVVAMNAQWIGAWNMAPTAHPNDGRLDVIDGSLGLGDRLRARSRLAVGGHLPHPRLRTQRSAEIEVDLDRSTPVRLDGRRVGVARQLRITCLPDALTVVV